MSPWFSIQIFIVWDTIKMSRACLENKIAPLMYHSEIIPKDKSKPSMFTAGTELLIDLPLSCWMNKFATPTVDCHILRLLPLSCWMSLFTTPTFDYQPVRVLYANNCCKFTIWMANIENEKYPSMMHAFSFVTKTLPSKPAWKV